MIPLPIGVHTDPAGGPALATQIWNRVGGKAVVRLGDPVTPHDDSPHDAATMAIAAPWYRVSGIGVCRQTDLATCGHPLVSSQPWYKVA